MPRVHEDVCVRPIVLPKLYGGVPFRCTGSHIEHVPTVEELTMGCTRVNVPAPLGSHDDREQERADGHQERKRARVARFVFDKGSAGAISARSTLLMAMKRFVNGHAAGTETIERPVPECTFLARLPCHGHAAHAAT